MKLTVVVQRSLPRSQTELSGLRASIQAAHLAQRQLLRFEDQLAHLAGNHAFVAVLDIMVHVWFISLKFKK